MKRLAKYGGSFLFVAVMAWLYLAPRNFAGAAGKARYLLLCDALTVPGALLLCAGLVAVKKERPGLRELLFGTAVGVPNFFSAKFLLMALADLPAVVVFPSFSIATMLIVTLAGVVFFKERLLKLQWVALVAIVAALLLLNL